MVPSAGTLSIGRDSPEILSGIPNLLQHPELSLFTSTLHLHPSSTNAAVSQASNPYFPASKL